MGSVTPTLFVHLFYKKRLYPFISLHEFLTRGKDRQDLILRGKGIFMNKKWIRILTGLFLTALISTGCINDDTPPPPPGDGQEDNQEDTEEEQPAVKEPTEKAEDLLDDGSVITEEEKQRDREMEEKTEQSLENQE